MNSQNESFCTGAPTPACRCRRAAALASSACSHSSSCSGWTWLSSSSVCVAFADHCVPRKRCGLGRSGSSLLASNGSSSSSGGSGSLIGAVHSLRSEPNPGQPRTWQPPRRVVPRPSRARSQRQRIRQASQLKSARAVSSARRAELTIGITSCLALRRSACRPAVSPGEDRRIRRRQF